jgi:ubiquinone/menaquinone biosynthesis C-methylase UbiE
VTELAELKADQARIWGSASWQNIAERQLFPVHDELVARLDPRPGARWLDLATGTGAVALRAARAGADVSAQDLAAPLIDTARELAAAEGLGVDFAVGDAERLDYPDASFDVVASAHGVVHAYDHRAVARELARVVRVGGRLGLTYWLPNPELQALMERVGYARPAGAGLPSDWVRRDHVTALLGETFELEFLEAICPWVGDSGEATWRLLIESDGPAREGVVNLSPGQRAEVERDWIEYFERHRTPDGVSVPRPYLLILGRRRAR